MQTPEFSNSFRLVNLSGEDKIILGITFTDERHSTLMNDYVLEDILAVKGSSRYGEEVWKALDLQSEALGKEFGDSYLIALDYAHHLRHYIPALPEGEDFGFLLYRKRETSLVNYELQRTQLIDRTRFMLKVFEQVKEILEQ